MEYQKPKMEVVEIHTVDIMLVSGSGDGGSTQFSLQRNLLGVGE